MPTKQQTKKPVTKPAVEKPSGSTAEAAAEEAQGTPVPIEVEFRGQSFAIDRELLNSAAFRFGIARNDWAGMLTGLVIDGADQARLIATARPGEAIWAFAGEFLGAVNAAAGFGEKHPN